jgi:hypothetical protein
MYCGFCGATHSAVEHPEEGVEAFRQQWCVKIAFAMSVANERLLDRIRHYRVSLNSSARRRNSGLQPSTTAIRAWQNCLIDFVDIERPLSE